MEKNRGSKVIAIVALCVAIAGLTLGFAAFSNTLTISSSATVTPDPNDFDVDFASEATLVDGAAVAEDIEAVLTPEPAVGSKFVAADAEIDNTSNPTIKNLSVTFTEPGQKAVYTFYTANVGKYDAYLRSITFKPAEVGKGSKVCKVIAKDPEEDQADEALVTAACEDIILKINVGGVEAIDTRTDMKDHKLTKGSTEQVVVTIEYVNNNHTVDGDFEVKFGDIELLYSTVDNK